MPRLRTFDTTSPGEDFDNNESMTCQKELFISYKEQQTDSISQS
jgi:hypothetical protein